MKENVKHANDKSAGQSPSDSNSEILNDSFFLKKIHLNQKSIHPGLFRELLLPEPSKREAQEIINY